MRVLQRYTLLWPNAEVTIVFPVGAIALDVGVDEGEPVLWAEVPLEEAVRVDDPEESTAAGVARTFSCVHTGEWVPGGDYLGTVNPDPNRPAIHIYETT